MELTSVDGDKDSTDALHPALGDPVPPTAREEAEVRKRADWRLLPILCLTVGLQYSDKSALSIAALFGVIQDLHLYSDDNGTFDTFKYSQASSIFFVGYIVGALPLSILAQRLSFRVACSLYILLWGICVILTPACTSFEGLMAQRFFLGFLESGVSPMTLSILSTWYTKQESALRATIVFSANGFLVLPLSVANWGVVAIGDPNHAWKNIFYFLGILTILWSAVVGLTLPDSPTSASFLTPRQRFVAVERLRANQVGVRTRAFKPAQAFAALRDPKVIVLFLLTFCMASPGGAVGSFAPLVISTVYGATPRRSILLSLPASVFGGMSNLIAGFIAMKVPNSRCAMLAFFGCLTALGAALQWGLPLSRREGILAGTYIITAFSACLGTMTGLVVANTGGASKRTAVGALMFCSSALSNIAAPFFFKKSEIPRYPTGFLLTVILVALGVVLIGVYALLCWQDNAKRDRARLKEGYHEDSEDHAFDDLTDVQNKEFRYSL